MSGLYSSETIIANDDTSDVDLVCSFDTRNYDSEPGGSYSGRIICAEECVKNNAAANDVVLRKVVKYAGLQRPWRYRLLSRVWNETVCLVHRKDIVAKCPSSRSKNPLEDTLLCRCDMRVIATSHSSPFSIRSFKLGNCWKDHMEKMNQFPQVEMESLELTSVSLFGKNVLTVPMHPSFLSEDGKLFKDVSEDVTSLPGDLTWLDTSLPMLSRTITQSRFQKLKKLSINVIINNVDCYILNNIFKPVFDRAVSQCVNNGQGLGFELPLLEYLEVSSFHDFGTIVQNMVVGLCNASPNLATLVLDNRRNGSCFESACIFSQVRPLPLKVLAIYPAGNHGIDAVVDFLNRSKFQKPTFSLQALTFTCPFFLGTDRLVNPTEIFALVAQSIRSLHISQSNYLWESRFILDFSPTMPRLATLRVDLGLLLSFPSLDLTKIMPVLKYCHFEQSIRKRGDKEVVTRRETHRVALNSTSMTLSFNVDNLHEMHVCEPTVTKPKDDNSRPGITMPVCTHAFSIDWFCPALTSLTFDSYLPCSTWLPRFLGPDFPFPTLKRLDVSLRLNDTVENSYDERFSTTNTVSACTLFDFAFTGLPDQVIKEYALLSAAPHPLLNVNPSDVIPLAERERCLVHITSLRDLVVRVYNNEYISDRAGFHGFALLTHLHSFYLMESRAIESTYPIRHALSRECQDFVRKALSPKTNVQFYSVEP